VIKEGLRDNGLIEGRDYVLETRFAAMTVFLTSRANWRKPV
jgi:hypothetical protein